MKFDNYMILDFPSKSANEDFARSAVACFAAQMDPTLEELGDIRTAVSEAVTNCIVHAYPEKLGNITLRCRILKDGVLDIVVKDKGVGIPDARKTRKGWGLNPVKSRCPSICVIERSALITTAIPEESTKDTSRKSRTQISGV